MVAGPTRSDATTLTLLRALPEGARTTNWKASYSFRAALIAADRAVPGASVGWTRVSGSVTHTVTPPVAAAATETLAVVLLLVSMASAITPPGSAATMM